MEEKDWYTTGETAKVLGVSFRTIKRWIYSGKISAVKTASGHYRIPKEEIERLLSQVKDQFAIDIIDLVKKRKVVYFREIQINLEDKYRHYETRDKLRSLVSNRKLKTKSEFGRRWYYPEDKDWGDVEEIAKEKLELVRFFEKYDRKFEREGVIYLDYSEYLVEQALIRAGYTVVAKDTYYFNGLVYLVKEGPGRPPDLDFIALLPNKRGFVGIQVKNRLEYPKSDAVNILIDLCKGLHLKPLLITRQAHPMTIDVIRRLGGWTIIFKQLLLKPVFPQDKLIALRKLVFPVAVYNWPPNYLINALIKAANAIKL